MARQELRTMVWDIQVYRVNTEAEESAKAFVAHMGCAAVSVAGAYGHTPAEAVAKALKLAEQA